MHIRPPGRKREKDKTAKAETEDYKMEKKQDKTGKCMCEMGDHAARTSNSGRRIMRERSGQRMLSEYERIIGRS